MADLIDRDAVLSDINEEIEANQEYPEDKLIRKGLRIARKAIENAQTVNRWIPCSERMPEQEVRILLFAAGEVYVGELTDIKDLYDTDIGFMKSGHVTHWMPLPEIPEPEKE